MSAKGKTRKSRWVIFARPQQHAAGSENLFIAWDGDKTESRRLAAKFYTWDDARKFATEKGIEIDGAMRYIDQVDFSDSELE